MIVQNSDPFTYFRKRPIRVVEPAGLDTGSLSVAVLKRATPLELPTLIPRLLSGSARTVHAPPPGGAAPGARRPTSRGDRRPPLPGAGRRRLHRRVRRGRVRRSPRGGCWRWRRQATPRRALQTCQRHGRRVPAESPRSPGRARACVLPGKDAGVGPLRARSARIRKRVCLPMKLSLVTAIVMTVPAGRKRAERGEAHELFRRRLPLPPERAALARAPDGDAEPAEPAPRARVTRAPPAAGRSRQGESTGSGTQQGRLRRGAGGR